MQRILHYFLHLHIICGGFIEWVTLVLLIPPHFHARYGEHKVAIEIKSLRILEGQLPGRALGLVMEWASQHQDELLEDWELAKSEKPPKKIEPLK